MSSVLSFSDKDLKSRETIMTENNASLSPFKNKQSINLNEIEWKYIGTILSMPLRLIFLVANIIVFYSTIKLSLKNYEFFSFWVEFFQLIFSILIVFFEVLRTTNKFSKNDDNNKSEEQLIITREENFYLFLLYKFYKNIFLFLCGSSFVIMVIFYSFWRSENIERYKSDLLFTISNELVHGGFVAYIYLEFLMQNVEFSIDEISLGGVIGNLYLNFSVIHFLITKAPVYRRWIEFKDGVIYNWLKVLFVGVNCLILSLITYIYSKYRKGKRMKF